MFKILHVPTGEFLHVFTRHGNNFYNPSIALFKSEAKAYKVLQTYRLTAYQVQAPHYYFLFHVKKYTVHNQHNNTDFILYRLSEKYFNNRPNKFLSDAEQKLTPKQKEKLLIKRNPEFLRHEEFLVFSAEEV